MRYLLIILLMLPVMVWGQTTVLPTGADSQATIQRGGYGANSVFVIPRDTNESKFANLRKDGRIAVINGTFTWYDTTQSKWIVAATGGGGTNKVDSVTASNDSLYYWVNGTKTFVDVIGGTAIDTTSLSNRIELRVKYIDTLRNGTVATYYYVDSLNDFNVKYSDTSAMLAPYLRKGDTAAMLSPYLRKNDTTSLSNRINQKLNIVDTTGKWLYDLYAGYGVIKSGSTQAPLIRVDTGATGLATQYDLTQLPAGDTDFVRTVVASSGVSNIGNSKDVHLVADTGVVATKAYVNSLQDTEFIRNQSTYQQDARFWVDSGFIDVASPYYRRKAYFYGDSRTKGFGLSDTMLRWSSQVSNNFGWTEDNRALSGTTLEKRSPIDYFASPNMVDNISTIPVYDATRDAYLFIAYGYNDIRYNGGSYDSTNFRTDYTTVVNAALANGWPANRIVMVAIWYNTPTSYIGVLGQPAATETRHKSFNYVIQTLASQKGCLFYDSYEYMRRYIGAYGFQPADSIHDNYSSEKVKASGAIQLLQYEVMKNGQQLAVGKTTEVQKLILRSSDTGTINTMPLGVSDSGIVVRMPNKFIENNTTNVAQGGSIHVNGKITTSTASATGVEDANHIGLSTGYWIATAAYSGSTTSGAKLIGAFSTIGRISAYNHSTSTPLQIALNENGGIVTVGTASVQSDAGFQVASGMSGYAMLVGAFGDFIPAGATSGGLMRYAANHFLLYSLGNNHINMQLNALSTGVVTIGSLNDGTGRKFQVTGVGGFSDSVVAANLRATTKSNDIVKFSSNGSLVGAVADTDYVAPSALTGYLLITNIVTEETPNGTINGINTAFTLDFTPVTGTVKLYLNGQRLTSGVDFTISGSNITAINIPLTGDKYFADYIKQYIYWWLLLLGIPFRIKRTKKFIRFELLKPLKF